MMFDREEWRRQYNIKNKIRLSKYNKRYHKEYYIKNKEKVKERVNKYRKNNPEKMKECKKLYYIKHKKYVNTKNMEYYFNNREERLKKMYQYMKNRKKTNLKFNLSCRISVAIYISLRGNKAGRHWETLVGYTLKNLIKRLNKTIPECYTWNDYMNGKLHIDHIIPISVFNFTRPEHTDFKRCWALSNLRLLPAKENQIKHAKLDKPFQPALQI